MGAEMKSCKWVNEKLSAFVAGDLGPDKSREIEEHLATCSHCRFELELAKRIAVASAGFCADGEQAARDVNWDVMEARIFALATTGRENWRSLLFSGILQGALAVLVLVPVLLVMLQKVPGPVVTPKIYLSTSALNRMETNLARNEVRQVLSKSRMVLSEFMEQCPGQSEGPFSWQSGRDVRDLMAKNRMLRKDLDRARLQHARGLCRKLDMVFSEMASVSRKDGCRDVTRLQKLLRREHIFLKIRLVEEELKRSEG